MSLIRRGRKRKHVDVDSRREEIPAVPGSIECLLVRGQNNTPGLCGSLGQPSARANWALRVQNVLNVWRESRARLAVRAPKKEEQNERGIREYCPSFPDDRMPRKMCDPATHPIF